VGLLELKESKTNPNATGWSVIRRATVNAFICGLSALIVLALKGTLEENWGLVIVFTLIGAFIGALWEWQTGHDPD